MAASPRAPKQWQLTKIETITSYESWRQNLIYVLSLDKNFVRFLDATWQKQTAANPLSGLTDNGTAIPEAQRLTAAQKNTHLDLLLGQIANFCPVISRNSIVKHFQPQSSVEAPGSIGVSFAADVARRHRQLILVLRETVSSYTLTTLVKSEKHEDLRNALIVLCSQLSSLHDGGVTVRVDPAPGFCALASDPILLSHGITLEIGRVKNPNKNPVAERAIEELGLKLLNLSPEGGPVSDVTLALDTANTNSRIRRDGLSAREVWTQRGQLTGEQLPIVDRHLILSQNYSRQQNHYPS